MAKTEYTISPFQTAQDASVPTATIQTPTTPPQVYSAPPMDAGAQFDAAQAPVTPETQAIIDENKQYREVLGLGAQAKSEQVQQFANMGGVESQSRVNQLTRDYNMLDNIAKGKEQAYLANRTAGGGGTASGTATTFEGIQRENAVAKWSKMADIYAAQNNVDQAKASSEQAILAKYGDVQAKIDTQKAFYEMNKDTLSRLDKKNYDRQLYVLDQKKKENDAKIKNATEISDMIIEAIPSAPTSIIANAKKLADSGASKLVVAQSLGVHGGDYYARLKIKAEINKMDADAAKARRESSSGSATSAISSSAKDWVAQFNSGLLSADEIYTKIGSSKESSVLKNQVASLIAAQGGKRVYGTDDATIQAINAQIKNVDDLLNGGVGKIVGVVQGGAAIFLPDSLNVGKQDALATAKNLVDNQTLQSLADAKAKGITFGALSETELSTIAGAASRVASKIKRDKETKEIVGFSGSESEFKSDLKIIKDNLQKSIEGKTQSKQPNQTPADTTADDIMTANRKVVKEQSQNQWITP